MTKTQLVAPLLLAALLGLGSTSAPAQAAVCKAISGTGFAESVDDSTLVASLSGALRGGARGRITRQQTTADGLLLDMEHDFFTDDGGLLHTKDKATLTAVPGKGAAYMLEITYDVVEASGAFTGYGGGFRSVGLIALDVGKVVLRYSGEICK